MTKRTMVALMALAVSGCSSGDAPDRAAATGRPGAGQASRPASTAPTAEDRRALALRIRKNSAEAARGHVKGRAETQMQFQRRMSAERAMRRRGETPAFPSAR